VSIFFILIGTFATGCKSKDEAAKAQSGEKASAAAQRDQAITAMKGAARSIQHYTYAQRDEFINAAKRDLTVLKEEVDELRATVDRSSGEARADAEAKLEVVREKWAAAKTHLDQAEAATETGWEDVQSRYRSAHKELKETFDATRQWLSDKIKP
jgi:hypothetical protein